MSYGSDHHHYDYADTRHDHRGQYAEDRHDHDLDYAEKHHRHYDDESTVRGLREDLSRAEERIRELEDDLRDALNRIHALEDWQPDYAGEDGRADEERAREGTETAMSATERAEYDEMSEAHLDAADEARDLAREDGDYDDCEPTL
jgi:hypothetical protein